MGLGSMIKCEWDNRIEQDKCQKCGAVPDEMWFVPVPSAYEGSGLYYCKKCATEYEELINNDD